MFFLAMVWRATTENRNLRITLESADPVGVVKLLAARLIGEHWRYTPFRSKIELASYFEHQLISSMTPLTLRDAIHHIARDCALPGHRGSGSGTHGPKALSFNSDEADNPRPEILRSFLELMLRSILVVSLALYPIGTGVYKR
jgi:hypothetical protein